MGKAKYAWITAVPMFAVGGMTLAAAVLSIRDIFWPLTARPGQQLTGYLDTALMALFILGVLLVVFDAIRRWIAVLNGASAPPEAFGPQATPGSEVGMGCC